jgi:DNA-directed RNA polymerase specialized sigma24 family protein
MVRPVAGPDGTTMPADRLPDETLLAGLGAGDADLSLSFVQRFQHVVFGAALSVLGDPTAAEEVALRTFECAWRHAPLYDARRGSVQRWLLASARNLAVAAAPTGPASPEALPALLAEMSNLSGPSAADRDNAALLRGALAALPPGQARAVVMAAVHGMAGRQIAEAEGTSEGTAKNQLADGLRTLRAARPPTEGRTNFRSSPGTSTLAVRC